MKQRVVTMIAVAALLIVGAAPALAAPGGVPGPPADHVQGADDVTADDADGPGPPDHAKAYGYRIKDAFGVPYGHLQQCNADVEAFEACPDAMEMIEGMLWPEEPGAKVFWMTYDSFVAE